MSYKYVISAILRQSKECSIDFERIKVNGISVVPQNENSVKLQIELLGDDDQKILESAKKRFESLVLALSLMFGVPLILGNLQIEGKESISEKQKTVVVYNYLTVTSSVSVKKKPSIKQLNEIPALTTKIDSLESCKREALSRIHKWFSRAEFDDDPVDRFIQLYIALEVIGELKYPKKSFSKRVEKILSDQLCDSVLASNIVITRGALLHSGQKESEVRQYIPYMEKTILESMKKMLDVT